MWLSLEVASKLYHWANIGLIASLVGGAVSTVFVVWMGNIKEEYLNRDLGAAQERSTLLESQITESQKAISEANARAAEAKLELERLKAPRILDESQRQALVEATKAFVNQEYCALLPPAGLDTESFWAILNKTLSDAGWKRVDPPGLVVGEPPAGVAINAPPGVFLGVAPSQKDRIGAAAVALAKALNDVGIMAEAGLDNEAEKKPGVIRIVIGLKPR
ncbi:hypothetical protein [Marinobacter sediminum]|uniref:hypothetical protein n=1 Tax=Marinobacter sediminum TaxID=256323 RepID=UPI00193931C6|nr:hypothetical protein [Marinobacter sediminum]